MKINKDGYWQDKNLGLIHRRAYTKVHGKIPENWVVHHLDENKTNNAIRNLIAMPWHCHDQLHAMQRKEGRLFSRQEVERMIRLHVDYTKTLQREQTALEKKLVELKERIRIRTSKHLPKKKR